MSQQMLIPSKRLTPYTTIQDPALFQLKKEEQEVRDRNDMLRTKQILKKQYEMWNLPDLLYKEKSGDLKFYSYDTYEFGFSEGDIIREVIKEKNTTQYIKLKRQYNPNMGDVEIPGRELSDYDEDLEYKEKPKNIKNWGEWFFGLLPQRLRMNNNEEQI